MNRRLMLALKLLFNLTSQILYASVASVLCTITSPCAIEQFEVESTAASLNFDDMEKESEPILALPWREFDVDLHHGGFEIAGKGLRILEESNTGKGTGLVVWDGSVMLAKYLEHSGKVDGKRVLEMGAGTGLVGISAALLGAKEIILTDLEYTLHNIRANVDLNRPAFASSHQIVEVLELDWFSFPTNMKQGKTHMDECEGARSEMLAITKLQPSVVRKKVTALDVEVVLLADVVWVEELIEPLVSSLESIFLTPSRNADSRVAYMSYQSRSTRADRLLFSTLTRFCFIYFEIPSAQHHPKFKSNRIKLYEIRRSG